MLLDVRTHPQCIKALVKKWNIKLKINVLFSIPKIESYPIPFWLNYKTFSLISLQGTTHTYTHITPILKEIKLFGPRRFGDIMGFFK